MALNQAERRPLLLPLHRNRLHQRRQRHPLRLSPIQDRLHDIRRQQREPQQARDIGRVDLLGGGQFVERGEAPRLHHPPPPERAGQRLHQRGVGSRGAAGRHSAQRHHQLPPTPLPDRERHADGQHPRSAAHAAAFAESAAGAPRSRTRLASPSSFRRTSAPPAPMSTRSTRRWMMRACSAGKSSPPTADLAAPAPAAPRPPSCPAPRPAPRATPQAPPPAAGAAPGPER